MASGKDSDHNLGYMTRKDAELKLPRTTRVKNKTPAPVQITAEQLLREARERQEDEIRPPKQKITDLNELSDYRLRRRKEFEDQIRRARWNIQVWVKYAQWEKSQMDYARARSVWERALEGDYRNHTLWVKYAEFEMKNKFVNRARNVWDRAVTLLPRVDQLWYKYIYMGEKLGNIAEARKILERWMNWSPDQKAWLKYNEIERARSIYQRFFLCHPKVSAFIRYAKFEMKRGQVELAREVYERATDELANDEEAEILFVAFAEFEERCKEVERARFTTSLLLIIFLKEELRICTGSLWRLRNSMGIRKGLRMPLLGRRGFEYEDEVRKNPLNYDKWFDYVRLEETVGNKDRIREVYERAIAHVPPAQEKLWINYALYEEVETEDVERTRDVYSSYQTLQRMPQAYPPHQIYFCQNMVARCTIRQLNLTGARQILGNAIGKAPKDKIFKKYIEIELQLGNIDRCRKLYKRYLEWSPENCYAWRNYTETERVRAIFELAITHPALDMPELLWKTYIGFEISQGELERTRALYERLLDRTKHCKMWVSFAKFEASTAEHKEDEEEEEDAIERKVDSIRRARAIFDRANAYYKDSTPELKEERSTLLEDWLNMETGFGKLGDVSVVQPKLPKKLKKRKMTGREDGSTEYALHTYNFPICYFWNVRLEC